MKCEYALFVLKNEKMKLNDKLLDMSLLEDVGEKINERMRTKYKQQSASLEFAIDVLEKYNN